MYSKELLKGTLQTIILKLLDEHEKMYGYEITQKVKEESDGKILITEGALYPTLHKLESRGLVTTEKVYIGKRVRKYYRITQSGGALAKAKLREFSEFMETMSMVLDLKPSLKIKS